MYCTKCGKEIDEKAMFCTSCGNQINNITKDNKSIKKDQTIIARWILFSFLVLVGLGGLSFNYGGFIILLGAIIVIPLLDNMLNKIKLINSIKIIIAIILFFIGMYISGTSPEYMEYENNKILENNIKANELIVQEQIAAEEKAIQEKKEAEEKAIQEQKEAEEKAAKEKREAEEKAAKELAKAQTIKNYKDSCQSYAYKDLARNPNKYVGQKVKFTGKVIQVQNELLNSVVLLVNVTKSSYEYLDYDFYEDTIYVEYTYPSSDSSKILEDDVISLYGEFKGEKTYLNVLGSTNTIPRIDAKYIDLNN